ncbi:MAG TPA: alkaline phosphatase family protein [Terracidiphilus sp.]|nr:alkaline phosphatase family protein [Terracidiphilus sp.]
MISVILIENHAYMQVIGNPNMPFTNKYAASVNMATNYYAVGHPSLTNYLEIVGGSNFGVRDDNAPDWHNSACSSNIVASTVSLENTSTAICPISGTGTDGATPVIDYTNEVSGPPGAIDIDGVHGYAANPNTVAETIADELVQAGKSWKSYQESLPSTGADSVNTADGFFSNLTDIPTALPGTGLTNSSLVALYAVKHNPFAYFQNVQEGANPDLSLQQMAGFEGKGGLFADLASARVPSLSFIAPNQCNDQHGRGNAGAICEYDPNDNGTLTGLNPGLMYQGDVTLQTLVTAIHKSEAWQRGKNAIVIVWDENDYSVSPTTNRVLLTVDTNYGRRGVKSNKYYTHFSLLRSLEAGFRLPCLNHACDASTAVISDLFASGDRDQDNNEQ